jgi:hypothetical protein
VKAEMTRGSKKKAASYVDHLEHVVAEPEKKSYMRKETDHQEYEDTDNAYVDQEKKAYIRKETDHQEYEDTDDAYIGQEKKSYMRKETDHQEYEDIDDAYIGQEKKHYMRKETDSDPTDYIASYRNKRGDSPASRQDLKYYDGTEQSSSGGRGGSTSNGCRCLCVSCKCVLSLVLQILILGAIVMSIFGAMCVNYHVEGAHNDNIGWACIPHPTSIGMDGEDMGWVMIVVGAVLAQWFFAVYLSKEDVLDFSTPWDEDEIGFSRCTAVARVGGYVMLVSAAVGLPIALFAIGVSGLVNEPNGTIAARLGVAEMWVMASVGACGILTMGGALLVLPRILDKTSGRSDVEGVGNTTSSFSYDGEGDSGNGPCCYLPCCLPCGLTWNVLLDLIFLFAPLKSESQCRTEYGSVTFVFI